MDREGGEVSEKLGTATRTKARWEALRAHLVPIHGDPHHDRFLTLEAIRAYMVQLESR